MSEPSLSKSTCIFGVGEHGVDVGCRKRHNSKSACIFEVGERGVGVVCRKRPNSKSTCIFGVGEHGVGVDVGKDLTVSLHASLG